MATRAVKRGVFGCLFATVLLVTPELSRLSRPFFLLIVLSLDPPKSAVKLARFGRNWAAFLGPVNHPIDGHGLKIKAMTRNAYKSTTRRMHSLSEVSFCSAQLGEPICHIFMPVQALVVDEYRDP